MFLFIAIMNENNENHCWLASTMTNNVIWENQTCDSNHFCSILLVDNEPMRKSIVSKLYFTYVTLTGSTTFSEH